MRLRPRRIRPREALASHRYIIKLEAKARQKRSKGPLIAISQRRLTNLLVDLIECGDRKRIEHAILRRIP